MLRPERRTTGDLLAVGLIVLLVGTVGVVIWQRSDARAMNAQPAGTPAAVPDSPSRPPERLTEAWRARSPATPVPTVAGPAVVTAQGHEVLGHDPTTGAVRWRFSRNHPLCTVGAEWDRAIAVYGKSRNCSEVTTLDGEDGQIGPQRNGDAEFGTRLLSDGTYVTATGRGLIETWRSDLVRTQQYGRVPTPLNADTQPRPNCDHRSVAAGGGRVGVIERCPGDPGDRFTLLRAKPSDDEQPEDLFSTVLNSADASVVEVNGSHAAVLLPNQSRLVVYRSNGGIAAEYPVDAAPRPGGARSGSGVHVEPTETSAATYWYTGRETLALSRSDLRPMWSVPGTLGPGALYGGRFLVPVPGGLAVHDPLSGARERVIPVDRQGYRGPVSLDSIGQVLVEKRGDTVVALR